MIIAPDRTLLAIAVAVLLQVASNAEVAAGGRSTPSPDGAALYRTYCASCHGTSGQGDGAMAQYLRLPPANLTRIPLRDGAFPAEWVGKIIDGRQTVRAHGLSEMPVWGDAFARSIIEADNQAIDAKIRALVKYLASIQERRAE